ncbi:MAG: ABC transporter ATP-binding protein, partial [Proteobacteria bacterium]|nr:ABC transporter ATP-binding protein [Pseudomonadota bacterium]
MLDVQHLSVAYGPTVVLRDVSFNVPAGSIVALLGGNGAGKTTILNTLSGLVRPRGGAFRFEGADCARLRPDELVRKGVVQVPQGREVFATMSVEENLELGAATRRDWPAIRADAAEMLELFPRLKDKRGRRADSLSGGEQQMVAIARALMARPKLLLMDEPSAGLAPQLVEEIFEIVRKLNEERRVTFLLAEQNTNVALRYAHHGYILE